MEKMIDVGCLVAGSDTEYTLLVEKLADFVSRRKSEGEGVIILLSRAKKLDIEQRRMDIIRLLGKAALRLSKNSTTNIKSKRSISYLWHTGVQDFFGQREQPVSLLHPPR